MTFTDWFNKQGFRHFSAGEFTRYFAAQRKGVTNSTPPQRLWKKIVPALRIVDDLRASFGKPCRILSSYRSPDYNRKVGGVQFSQHKEFTALDIAFDGVSPQRVYQRLMEWRRAGRFSYVSFDPEALYLNEAVEIEPLPVPEKSSDGEGGSNGTEDPEHVRRVLSHLAEKIGPYQDRNTWLHIVGSTVDAVGADAAGEIVDEYFPPLEAHHDSAFDVAHTLSGTWESLRKFKIDPVDHLKALPDLTDKNDPAKSKPARKRLADYLVNHSDTLGMSWQEIDALRPPYIIDGFMRRGEVLLLGAESKSKKSWLTQDAGFAVAAGLPWLADVSGAHGFATAQARVHVFDLELSPPEMRYRFAKARGNRFVESSEDAAAMTARIFAGCTRRDTSAELDRLRSELATAKKSATAPKKGETENPLACEHDHILRRFCTSQSTLTDVRQNAIAELSARGITVSRDGTCFSQSTRKTPRASGRGNGKLA